MTDTDTYRRQLLSLRARLRGDVDQMTEEALSRNGTDASGSLSNAPIHLADLGTDNYEQEFTLSLIENEQGTLEEIDGALLRIDQGTYGQCEDCGKGIAKARLQALPYARHCIECARKLEG